ncbi:TetR family transcriptional regulator [Gemmatimonadetes bacterium T265]|nr:TetR family transcriptional regulator [Gemmatimonadetes bacterium T265]
MTAAPTAPDVASPDATTPAAPPRRERDGDLRTAILDAARQLLVREGYRDLSMRDVSRAVGCSVSSIYLYFANKDALVHALMDEGFARWHRRMTELAAEGAGAPAPARLEAVCRAYVAFGLANPEFYEIMYMFHSDRMARYPKELFRRARRNLDLMGALVAECRAAVGVGTGDDVPVATTALWAALHGTVSTIIADRLDRRLDRERYVEGAVRFALAGVLA